MKKFLKILSDCTLFSDIEKEKIPLLLDCLRARTEKFDKKYTIFSEGSSTSVIGIMLSGSAQISHVDYYGNRSILSNVKAGEIFAEAFACAGIETLPVSVIANEPSEVMFIDSDHVLHTCKNNCGFHNQLIFNLMKDLARKTISLHKRALITSKRTTREKLMTYLLSYAKEQGKNSFKIPFDRQELADYLEVDRSGMSAEISKLRKEGIIKSNKSYFEIL